MSIKVINVNDAVKSLTEKKENAINITKKSNEKKYEQGAFFLNLTWNVSIGEKLSGWFIAENIILSRGVSDPEDQSDQRNKIDEKTGKMNMRLFLETTIANSGAFGQHMLLADEYITEAIKKVGNGDNKVFFLGNKRKFHGLVKTHLSDNNKENPGASIEDPIIYIKIDFNPYPRNFIKCLANKPKTRFEDFKRPRATTPDGKIQYNTASVFNPDTKKHELVNESNMHHFLTRGSKIVKMRYSIASICVSTQFVSFNVLADTVLVETADPETFDDDFGSPNEDIPAIPNDLTTGVKPNISNNDNVVDANVENNDSIDVGAIIDELDM